MWHGNGRWLRAFVIAMGIFAMMSGLVPHSARAAEMLHNIALERSLHLFEAGGRYRFPCPVFGICNHRIVGIFQTRRRGAPETWIVAAIPNEESCHGCTSRMTLEVYRKRGDKWRRHRVWRNFDEAGNWGRVSPEWVRMGKLDDRRMILFLHSPFLQMGEALETVSIHLVDDHGISHAGTFCLLYSNEGAVEPGSGEKVIEWHADYALVSSGERPKLVFRIRADVDPATATVVYDIIDKRLRLASAGDVRLNMPCGAHLADHGSR